jgi:hypothetical protein
MTKLRHFIAFFGILLFTLMGLKWMNSYTLWDDEANTALFAQAVHKTGDTTAQLGHNLIAYRQGAELNENLKARYVSPLQYYFLAPFINPNHPDPFQARIPFFILTLISLILIYRRLILLNLPYFHDYCIYVLKCRTHLFFIVRGSSALLCTDLFLHALTQ